MDLLANRYFHIVLVNLSVGLVVYAVDRFIPELGRKRTGGLFFIFIPIGFVLCEWDISSKFIGIMVLIGVGLLLVGFKKAIREVS